ncbi:hypothetical protein M885DRAFT_520998 [Pelagophyceae sp. CCMP2097]|nr:hypothetical protein M885DRAFT_520998 [Pelagophyceae sp. CCMP2097]
MRLGERKLLVVGALLDEAEVESARCEAETERCNTEVALDDERMELRDEQRKQLFAEIRTLEVEYAHWCRLFASRSEERRDVLAGLRVLRAERRDSLFDIAEWTKDVKWLQRHLPQATGRIIGLEAATATAMALNTTFEHIGGGTAAGQWNKLAALKGHMSAMMTPAEDVRRRHQHEGHQALTLPERQWAVLDRTVFPDKYDWLSESDAADDARRAARGAAPKAALKRLPRACRGFAGFTPGELRRIDGMNFERLERNERPAWRLLHAYHDDPAKMHAGADEKTSPNNLANAVRCKHPKSRSREEREWVSLDRVLNPTLWRGLKIRDEANASPYANVERERERSEYLTPVDGLPPGALQAKDGTELMPDASPEKTRAGVGPALGNVVEAAVARASSLGSRLSGGNALDWDCPLDRAKLVEVWACSAPKVAFDADQRRSFDLLKKYNGPYALFVSFQREGAERAKARIRHVGNRLAGRVDLRDSTVETDLDARCRLLQEHMDVAVHNSNPTMASDVLHGGVPQRYPTHVLRLEIERELDCLLREQVYERERSQRFLLEMDDDEDRAGSSGDEAQDRQRNDQQLGKGVFAARKAVLLEKGKDAAAKASEAELAALGPRACFACRARQCEWKNSCDEAAITLRRNELSDEIVFTKLNPTMMFVESYVPLSASRGGNPQFRRADLIHELCWEDKELDLRLRLNALDRELHDAYATRKEYVEVKALHRYSTMMWTSNARRALERERNKYVASVVASDVVDECLEAMLEGWYFGERTSAFQVAGYVPSLKPEGFVKAGQDQVMAQAAAEDREAKRFKDGPSSEDLDSKRSGSPRSKAARIEAEAQFRLGEEKVLKAGSERAEHMDFTERTLKFGLFMITMQFFRSMAMIHREKASWNDEADGDAKTAPTDERRALRREQARAAERQAKLGVAMTRAKVGEARARARLDAERGAAAHKLRTKVRREQLDLASCALLQRLYRGHVGRKAARRWAIKRAELEAINALMTASAITMQRCFRGYQGRISASVARMEMAEFISMIRLEEAALDEEEYWRTHSYARFKKNAKMFLSSLSSGSGTKGLGDEDLAMIQRLQTTMEETND